jgi:hypothetical protein
MLDANPGLWRNLNFPTLGQYFIGNILFPEKTLVFPAPKSGLVPEALRWKILAIYWKIYDQVVRGY